MHCRILIIFLVLFVWSTEAEEGKNLTARHGESPDKTYYKPFLLTHHHQAGFYHTKHHGLFRFGILKRFESLLHNIMDMFSRWSFKNKQLFWITPVFNILNVNRLQQDGQIQAFQTLMNFLNSQLSYNVIEGFKCCDQFSTKLQIFQSFFNYLYQTVNIPSNVQQAITIIQKNEYIDYNVANTPLGFNRPIPSELLLQILSLMTIINRQKIIKDQNQRHLEAVIQYLMQDFNYQSQNINGISMNQFNNIDIQNIYNAYHQVVSGASVSPNLVFQNGMQASQVIKQFFTQIMPYCPPNIRTSIEKVIVYL